MEAYANRTGLRSHEAQRRYLWTDSFAVGNCLGLHALNPSDGWLGLAGDLVAAVHHVLGRHRPDDPRTGWISGLGEEEGARHPTAGGLRIGKTLPERGEDDPVRPGLEWERDGQYYHYLTRWMRALHRFSRVAADPDAARWAVELAGAAFNGFTRWSDSGPEQLAWKMSVDLSRPLVPSSGHLDPLDGLVTAELLRDGGAGALADVVRGLEPLCEARSWATDDPLGIGGLLEAATILATLVRRGLTGRDPLLARMLDDADRSLDAFDEDRLLSLPADRRLAFREIGLSIGLAAIARAREALEGETGSVAAWLRPQIHRLASRADLGDRIIDFWRDPEHRAAESWAEHADISDVMLATALLPEGWLGPP